MNEEGIRIFLDAHYGENFCVNFSFQEVQTLYNILMGLRVEDFRDTDTLLDAALEQWAGAVGGPGDTEIHDVPAHIGGGGAGGTIIGAAMNGILTNTEPLFYTTKYIYSDAVVKQQEPEDPVEKSITDILNWLKTGPLSLLPYLILSSDLYFGVADRLGLDDPEQIEYTYNGGNGKILIKNEECIVKTT